MHSTDLKTPIRNRYFYGKLLDVYHFQLETSYLNAKRWLLNRLISGYGVVCGLDVKAAPDNKGIIVTPGLAIDKWGREIIISREAEPIPIPSHLIPKPQTDITQASQEKPPEEKFVHLLLCYHECESDPAPILTGDNCGVPACEPGTIRERYKLEFKAGAVPPPLKDVCIPDFISGGHIDYPQLAKYVTTHGCRQLPKDPCIPLANIRVAPVDDDPCHLQEDDIDITIRPIVFTNDLLFKLLLSLIHEDNHGEIK
jgi:hypothetical protein